jgi:hypothetical protein
MTWEEASLKLILSKKFHLMGKYLMFDFIFNKKGNLIVRVNETEATIDYTIPLEEEKNHFEFPCRSKVKKKQRKKVAEAGKEVTEANRIEVPIKWIRIDPECDWLRIIKFEQSEEMWIHQLETDKDVIAQSEASTSLVQFNTSQTALTKLENAAFDKSIYYRVRIEALESMSKFPQQMGVSGVDLVIKCFKTLFYDKKMTYLKPNDFTNFQEYFIKKQIPLIVVKESNSLSTLKFLLEILKNNDNSDNKYSDCFYVGNIIQALGMIETDQIEKVLKHVKRILVMDSLIPTPKNILTCFSLYSFSFIEASGRDSKNFDQFMDLITHDNLYELRKAAAISMFNIITSPKSKFDAIDNFMDEIFKILLDENQNKKYQIFLISCLNKSIRQIIQKKDKLSPLGKFLEFLKGTDVKAHNTIQKLWGILRSSIPDYSGELRRLFISIYYSIWKYRSPNSCSLVPYDEELELQLRESNQQTRREVVPNLSMSSFPLDKKRKVELQKPKPKKKKTESGTPTSKVTIKLGNQTIEREIEAEETLVYYTPEELEEQELVKRTIQEKDKKILAIQIEEEDRLRKERFEKGIGDKTVLLIGQFVYTIRLYGTETAEALYRSLPITVTDTVSEVKGLVYFPARGMIFTNQEKYQRQVVQKGELAYWVDGNSICIGHSITLYTAKKTSDIVLYQPCNVFGYTEQNVKKLHDNTDIIIERPRRCVVEFEKSKLKFQIDIGLDQASNYIWENLSITNSALAEYGKMRYFPCNGNPLLKPTKKTPEDIYRNYIHYGEVAYWANGDSIILGTGPSEHPDQANHPDRIMLIDSVYVFGRIVTNIDKISKVDLVSDGILERVIMYKRCVKITIGEQISFFVDLYDCITSDEIFDRLPLKSKSKLFGNSVNFAIDVENKIPIEPNRDKDVVKPEDICFSVENSSIYICWGSTPSGLLTGHNVFGRIRRDHNMIELMEMMNGKEDLDVLIEEDNGIKQLF